ncbi:MAG: lipoprotein insertase outer membrane protein LolB [Casimicrobiaceae bacterium]
MKVPRALRGALAVIAVAGAAGCATVVPPPVAPVAIETAAAFDASGRLSARRGSEGVAANFTWAHAPDSDRFDVATPLGQVIARLSGDPSGVNLQRPGQVPVAYADWSALTRDVFGVAIPVDGLASWIQAQPVAGTAFDLERDAHGRPLVLRQQGWEIVYAYANPQPAANPMRLVMRYPDSEPIEVRIVVDRWQLAATIR